MKGRFGVFFIAVIFTFGAGFVLQDPKTKTEGDTGIKGQKVTTKDDKNRDDKKKTAKWKGSDHDFVMKASAAGKAEVEAGQLALTKASSADVKQFAQRMIDDHSKANDELTQLVQSKGWSMTANEMSHDNAKTDTTSASSDTNKSSDTNRSTDTSKNPDANKWSDSNRPMATDDKKMQSDHKAMMDKLSGLSGAEFDREYMRHMVMDHEKAVALFTRESKNKNGDDELEKWAEKTLPTLQEHLRMAREVAGKVGAKVSDSSAKNK
jgi:putative membrane protein